MERTLSEIFSIAPSFCLRKIRKNCFKNVLKVSRFSNKIQTRAEIKNLRHGSLQGTISVISENFMKFYQVLGQISLAEK